MKHALEEGGPLGLLRRWLRRALTIPAYSLLALAYWASLPAGLLLAAVLDLAGLARRRPLTRPFSWGLTRTYLLLGLYLSCEVAGMAASLVLWLARVITRAPRERFLDWNFRLQCWWAGTLARGGARLFRIRFQIEGEEHIEHGPLLLLLRHSSLADTILAAYLVSSRTGLVLRYVLKRELLWDPCLDIVGNRLVNWFVERQGERSEEEIEAVGRLVLGLGPKEGVLLYPEGTRFSPEKRESRLARLASSGPPWQLERAKRLRHTLAPRLGGVLALLRRNAESGTGADVVFGAHAGFESAATLEQLTRGELYRRTVRVHFWRVPFEQIPTAPEAQAMWLYDQWQRVDELVAQNAERAPATVAAPAHALSEVAEVDP